MNSTFEFQMLDRRGLEQKLGTPYTNKSGNIRVYNDGISIGKYQYKNNVISEEAKELKEVLHIFHNENPGSDIGDLFLITVVTSPDGAKLNEYHHNYVPQNDELLLCLEDDDGKNYLGRLILAKVGKKAKKILAEKHDVNIVRLLEESNNHVSQEDIGDIIENALYPDGKVDGFFSFLKYVVTKVKHATFGALSKVFDYVGEALSSSFPKWVDKHIKIGDNRWDDTVKGYNPLFIPDSFYEKLNDLTNSTDVEKKVSDAITPFKSSILSIEKKIHRKIGDRKELQPLKRVVTNIFGGITSVLTYIVKNVTYFVKKYLEGLNAFLCGLCNSIVESIVGIIQVVGYLLRAVAFFLSLKSGDYYLKNAVKEGVENIIVAFQEVDWGKAYETVIQSVKDFSFSSFASTFTINKAAYYSGFLLGLVVETVVSILFSGGMITVSRILDDLLSPITDIVKGISKTVSGAKNVVEKITKKSKNLFSDIITQIYNCLIFLKNPDLIKKHIAEMIQEIKDEAQKIADFDLKEAFEKFFSKGFRESLSEAGYKPSRIIENGVVLCPIKHSK